DTMVLPLLNGLNHLDILDAAFGKERVLGGLCHISVTLSPDGHVQHLNKLQLLTFGPRHESQQRLCEALLPEMKRAGFKVILSDNPLQDMWEKFVML
ncbi:ketopantoate reductase family protein, partial [Enterococcus faecium]|uniref:ketopantoate reductase family protein n=1 Tax=Enterococcus faecium TaxID=1352 RepID=UPI003F43E371